MKWNDVNLQPIIGGLLAFCLGGAVFLLVDYSSTLTEAELAQVAMEREQDRLDALQQFQMELEMIKAAAPFMGCIK